MTTVKIGHRIFTVLMLTSIILGCSATDNLQMTTLEPAPVVLQQSIKRIGIINTSLPAKRADFENRLEQMISYEDYRLVKEGKKAALDALYKELSQDVRFDTVLLISESPDALLGLDAEPGTTAWEAIATLCAAQEIDAIFSLTSFEADTRVSSKKAQVESRDILRVRNTETGHELTLETLMENGWRIYSPAGNKIIDEFIYTNQVVASAKGITPVRALEALETREEDILKQSQETGSTYGLRLKPFKKEVARPYYSSGNENFKLAHREIENGNFEKARTLWEKELSNPKPKLIARAYYNLAVLEESYDRLNEALTLALKAKETDPNDLIVNYVSILEIRQEVAQTIADQLAYSGISKTP